jgi:hypothetical protein
MRLSAGRIAGRGATPEGPHPPAEYRSLSPGTTGENRAPGPGGSGVSSMNSRTCSRFSSVLIDSTWNCLTSSQ